MCDPVGEGECVPAFTRESERGPFVREVEKRDEKRLGTALVTAVLLDFPPLLDDGGSQRTGKCMYIKARVIPPPIRNVRVSACEPMCAIFLREPRVCAHFHS